MKNTLTLRLMIGIMLSTCVSARAGEQTKPWHEAYSQTVTAKFGLITWQSDMKEAKKMAAESGKPLMVLHAGDEVETVRFVKDKLNHFFVVDAATEFVPVIVKEGGPGVRFRAADGKSLDASIEKNAKFGDVVKAMADALKAVEKSVPLYLRTIVRENNIAKPQIALFGMG